MYDSGNIHLNRLVETSGSTVFLTWTDSSLGDCHPCYCPRYELLGELRGYSFDLMDTHCPYKARSRSLQTVIGSRD